MQNIAKVAQLSKFILIMTVSERPRSCWGPTQLARGSPLKQAPEISSTASRVNNQELALMSLPMRWVMKAASITATEFYGSVIPSNLYVPVNEWVASSRILVFTLTISGIATGQTLQLTRRKCMANGCSDVQKNDFIERFSLFSPLFYQKWIWVMLILRRRKFLFEKLCNM